MTTGGIKQMSSIAVLNVLILTGIVAAALIAAISDELFTSIIAMSILGLFMAMEFLLLKAPQVAFAEGVVSAILLPGLFFVVMRKVKDKTCQLQDDQKGDK